MPRRTPPPAGPEPGPNGSRAPGEPVVVIASEGGGAYERGADGAWRRGVDGAPVPGAGDLTLGDLFDPPRTEIAGRPVRLVPRAWASRHPDHPLAWTFEHADLGGRGPIPVPAAAWDERAGVVVAMHAAALHPWNLVGVDGVAALLGVREATVRAYLARRQMPEPLVRLGRAPVWSREQIEAWHATRTRARPAPASTRPTPDGDRGDDEPDAADEPESTDGAAVPDEQGDGALADGAAGGGAVRSDFHP